MPTPIFWTNVGVDIQNLIGTSQAITGITKANPGVATYSGADTLSNGDYVLITANGMTEVNDRIFRVANVNTTSNTFELEGEDTTSYGNFTSGSLAEVTYGASFANLQTFTGSGGDTEFADVTTIHDAIRKRAPTVISPLTFSSDAIFDVQDAGYIEANKAYKAKAKRAVLLRFSGGQKMAFNAYCAAPGVPLGQAQQVVQMRISFEAQNVPSLWAT